MAKLATSAPILSHIPWSNTFARVVLGPNDELGNLKRSPHEGTGLKRDTPAAESLLRRDTAVSCHSRCPGAVGEPVSNLAGSPVGPLDDLSVENESRRDTGPKVEVDARAHVGEGTPCELGERGQLHVVAEGRWQRGKRGRDRRGDLEALPTWDVGCEIDPIDTCETHRGDADGTDVTAARPLLAEHLVRESDRRFEHANGAAFGLGRQRAPTAQLPVGITDGRGDLRASDVECDNGARFITRHLSDVRA